MCRLVRVSPDILSTAPPLTSPSRGAWPTPCTASTNDIFFFLNRKKNLGIGFDSYGRLTRRCYAPPLCEEGSPANARRASRLGPQPPSLPGNFFFVGTPAPLTPSGHTSASGTPSTKKTFGQFAKHFFFWQKKIFRTIFLKKKLFFIKKNLFL